MKNKLFLLLFIGVTHSLFCMDKKPYDGIDLYKLLQDAQKKEQELRERNGDTGIQRVRKCYNLTKLLRVAIENQRREEQEGEEK